jgi:hypothetical protein
LRDPAVESGSLEKIGEQFQMNTYSSARSVIDGKKELIAKNRNLGGVEKRISPLNETQRQN